MAIVKTLPKKPIGKSFGVAISKCRHCGEHRRFAAQLTLEGAYEIVSDDSTTCPIMGTPCEPTKAGQGFRG